MQALFSDFEIKNGLKEGQYAVLRSLRRHIEAVPRSLPPLESIISLNMCGNLKDVIESLKSAIFIGYIEADL